MRAHRGLLMVIVLVTGMLAGAVPGFAEERPTVQGPTTVPEVVDYATRVLQDPWNYDNDEDLLTDTNGPTFHVTQPAFRDYTLTDAPPVDVVGWNVPVRDTGDGDIAAGWISPLWMTFPAPDDVDPPDYNGALPDSRDGFTNPIVTADYSHASLFVFASRPVAARLEWFRCWEVTSECRGGRSFSLAQGWQHVTVPLVNNTPDLPQEWAGEVQGLRITTAENVEHRIELDWLRLYTPDEPVQIDSDFGIVWDLDRDPANNVSDQPGWGVLPDGTFDVGAFPPGEYHLRSDIGYGDTLTVDAAPLPVIDDPDVAGGNDYATVERGDPWDFEQRSDITALRNTQNVSWIQDGLLAPGVPASGMLQGTNGPPAGNDPNMLMALAPDGIDTERYHRLTIRHHFDGVFDLTDDVLGGTHARLIWRRPDSTPIGTPGGRDFANTRELVNFTDRVSYTYDLHTTLVGSMSEPGNPEWRDAPATFLRYDPNEDRGARTWRVDDIAIRADDEADPIFDITWHDDTHESGTTVTLRLDTDRVGHDGIVVATDVAQTAGSNVFRLDASDIEPGTYWVSVTSVDGLSTTQAYSTGPLVVPARLSGPDRYATAVRLSQVSHPDGAPDVVVASGQRFPDAVAAGQVAAALEAPLLLVGSDTLPEVVTSELRRLGANRVIVAGGPVAVSDGVAQALDGVVDRVERVSGETRYDTALLLARRAVSAWRDRGVAVADAVVVASGVAFPDALSAQQYVTQLRAPLVLAPPSDPSEALVRGVAGFSPDELIAIGGEVAITSDGLATLAGDVATSRLAGQDRFETAARVRDAAIDEGADGARVLLASGRSFPDALAAAGVLQAQDATLLLTEKTSLPSTTRDALARVRPTWLRAVGGPSAIWDRVLIAAQ